MRKNLTNINKGGMAPVVTVNCACYSIELKQGAGNAPRGTCQFTISNYTIQIN